MYMPLHLIENVEMNKHRGDTPLSDLQSARRNLYSLFSWKSEVLHISSSCHILGNDARDTNGQQ